MSDYIYDKTINSIPSTDKFAVVPPLELLQIPAINEDWNRVLVGLIWSYTGSAYGTANVAVTADLGNRDPFDPETGGYCSFAGLGISAEDPKVPLNTGNSGFVGVAWDSFSRRGAANFSYNNDEFNKLGVNVGFWGGGSSASNVAPQLPMLASIDDTVLPGSTWSSRYESFMCDFNDTDKETAFAGFMGLDITVINKGQSNQQLVMILAFRSGDFALLPDITWSWYTNLISDTNITFLKEVLTLATNQRGNEQLPLTPPVTLNWSSNGQALALPNAFIFYNGFPASAEARPRLHSMIIKKLA